MKKIHKIKYILIVFISILTLSIYAQGGPGDPGGSPEGGNDPLGGSAPLSGGTIFLIAIGAVYGTKKVFELNQQSERNKP